MTGKLSYTVVTAEGFRGLESAVLDVMREMPKEARILAVMPTHFFRASTEQGDIRALQAAVFFEVPQ